MRMRIQAMLSMCVLTVAPAIFAAATTATETISVSPGTATVTAGSQKTFTATVAGLTSTVSLTWSVVSTAASSTGSLGTITSGGVYTAPASLPAPATVYVRATDSSSKIYGQATVTLLNAVPTVTSISPSSVNTGLAYTLTLTGTNFMSATQVQLDGTVVPSTLVSGTQITVSGKSTAAAGTVMKLTVTNPNDGTASPAAHSVTVNAPVAVTLTPDGRTIRCGSTLTLSPHVANNSDQTVTWTVSAGSVDSKNVYTAPAVLPATGTATIKATSHADPTASASITVTLQNPVPVVTAVSPSPLVAGSVNFTVTGMGFANGAKVLVSGVALPTTFVSDTKLTVTGTIAPQLGRVASVKVVNPNPGTATSAAFGVTVNHVATEKMSYADAVRFLEMASWGATPAAVAHLQQIGSAAWLTEQFATPTTPYPQPTSANEGFSPLQTAFFTNGLTAPDQLRLRVAFALHSIFVVAGNKDTQYWQMAPYLTLLSDNAFGTYRQLLEAVTLNPGMGFYLDMVNNAKATSTTAPNENYAREVMQLFTIGLTNLTGPSVGAPSYTQKTVTEMAKIFTGWTYAPEPGFASHWKNDAYYLAPMVSFDTYHDTTAKDLSELGCGIVNAAGTATSDLKAALDCLAKHPNTAQFISYRLIQRLVTSNPSTAYVNRVVAAWGTTGNLQTVINAILTDQEALSTSATPASKLREPVLYATTVLRALNANVLNSSADGVAAQSKAMGQDVLNPGSVFSYFSPFFKVAVGKTVVPAPEFQTVNTATSLARPNFVYKVVNNQISGNVKIDLSSWQDLASDSDVLVEAVNQALYRGAMTADEKTAVKNAVLAATAPSDRVKNAVYVAASAPQYQVEN